MDAEQRGWYWTLLIESLKTAGVLESQLDDLWMVARASSRDSFQAKQDAVLAAFDKTTDDAGNPTLTHRRMADLWHKQNDVHAKRVAGGKARAEQLRREREGNRIEQMAA